MVMKLIFKEPNIADGNNKKILVLGDDYDKITCLSLDLLNYMNKKIKFDNVIIVNGNETCKSSLSKKYDEIVYFDDNNLSTINHIIITQLYHKKDKFNSALIIFTDNVIKFNTRLRELVYNFHMYNTTLIIATTNVDVFSSQVDVRVQMDYTFSMNHWEKELIFKRFFNIFDTYDDFLKTFTYSTLNNGSIVMNNNTGYSNKSSLSSIYKYNLDISRYRIVKKDNKINLLEFTGDTFTLKL